MKEELKKRTKAFAIAVILMTENLPRKNSTFTITNQIIRSSTQRSLIEIIRSSYNHRSYIKLHIFYYSLVINFSLSTLNLSP
jgi:four helix bundle protein